MLENYIFKEVPLSDLEETISLIWNVFSEFEAPEYSYEGIEEFRKFIDYDSVKEKLKLSEIFLLGCYDGNKLIGIIGYNTKPHINLLFVKKSYHRQGIAKELFSKVLDYCKNTSDTFEVTVNSSPYAHPIYKKLGFADTDTEKNINGIRFFPMKYIYKQ